MEFQKIKYNKDKVEIKYKIDKDEYKLTSVEDPAPSFKEALQDLVDPLVDICQFEENYGVSINIISVSISNTDGIMGATITGLKELTTSYAPLVINTPHLPSADYSGSNPDAPLLPVEAINAIERLKIEAEKFIQGRRAQMTILDEMQISEN